MKVIVNAKVVLEHGILWDGIIKIEGNKIIEVKPAREAEIPADAEIIDAQGSYVGPGFIDIHVHGGNGFTTSFDTVEAGKYFLQHGETSILATPGYGFNLDKLIQAFRLIKSAMDSGEAKNVKGIYSEGPYTNSNYGANADLNPWKHTINPEEFKAFVDEGGSYVKVWTIAPEREGLLPFLEYARKVNPDVIFALGHSHATPMMVRSLGKYRPKILTHAMCANHRLPVYGGTRGYGPDEYCFTEPDMYAELISDSCGIHVHAEMQRLLLHHKGLHRVILITDGTSHANPAPDNLKHVTDLNFDHNGGIAGSKLTMDVACRNIMAHTGCGIAQAFVMASTNPAKALGMYNEIGSIEKDKIADLVFVDDIFHVKNVMLGGEMQRF
ncbi:MAG: amidohydrolase family protein [Clostridia bacterium]|nr:amidohydrolase family protein [Clostridia bacterium]